MGKMVELSAFLILLQRIKKPYLKQVRVIELWSSDPSIPLQA
jgi:hypothetical protein